MKKLKNILTIVIFLLVLPMLFGLLHLQENRFWLGVRIGAMTDIFILALFGLMCLLIWVDDKFTE